MKTAGQFANGMEKRFWRECVDTVIPKIENLPADQLRKLYDESLKGRDKMNTIKKVMLDVFAGLVYSILKDKHGIDMLEERSE